MQTCYFALSGGDAVPEWVRIMPFGEFRPANTRDKRGPWTLADMAAVIQTSMANGRLPVDENHSTDFAAPQGAPSPARGWITEMQARADGIHARIEWTDTGAALMADKAYRGFSPVFRTNKSGAVEQILRVSITNDPALPELNLAQSETPRMDLVQLRRTLGLAEAADEAAILAAIGANAQAVAGHAQTMTALTAAIGLPATTPADVLVTALTTQRAGASDLVVLRGQVDTLTAQLAAVRTEQAAAAATAFVDAAIAAGKPIVPLRAHYIARHQTDRANVETEINALTALNAGASHDAAGGTQAADGLTAVEEDTIKLMGLDRKKYVEHKQGKGGQA